MGYAESAEMIKKVINRKKNLKDLSIKHGMKVTLFWEDIDDLNNRLYYIVEHVKQERIFMKNVSIFENNLNRVGNPSQIKTYNYKKEHLK